MKYLFSICTVLSLLSLASCVEIIEDLSLNTDGSGTLKFNVNMSASKTKINGILALDSLNGKKIPSKLEIEEKLELYRQRIGKQVGISNVKIDADLTNYLVKLSLDFEKLEDIQNGLTHILEEDGSKNLNKLKNQSWISYSDSIFERKAIPFVTLFKDKIKPNQKDRLKESKYISITRFNQDVLSSSNPKSRISSNKRAVMVPYSPNGLLSGEENVANIIKF